MLESSKELQDKEKTLLDVMNDFNKVASHACSTFKELEKKIQSGINSSVNSESNQSNVGVNLSDSIDKDDNIVDEILSDIKKSVAAVSFRSRVNLLNINNLLNQQQLQLLPYHNIKSKFQSTSRM